MQPGSCALKCRLPSPALHRRVVLVSGARRCERLLWGPWRPGSTQARQLAQMKADKFDLYFCCNSVEASGDLKKLEAAHESVGHSIMPLLKLCIL